MNILVIGEFYEEGFASHIADTLEKIGHNTFRYEYGVKKYNSTGGSISKRWDKLKNKSYDLLSKIRNFRRCSLGGLWRLVRKSSIDISIVCYDDYLWPEEIEKLKRLSSSDVVMWFPDHIGNLDRAFCLNAPYDALFFKDPYIVHELESLASAPVYYLPECFNPDRHRLPEGTTQRDLDPYRCEITTAGNLHSFRVAFYKQLQDYDVKIWGNAPPRWLDPGPVQDMFQNHFVANEEKALAFRGAKIVVNRLRPMEIWGVNVRTFEAAGVGAFQLVSWRPGLDQLFSVGKEIVAFKNTRELKEKIDYYLENDKERRGISEKSRNKALNEHTYEKRLNTLINTVKGDKKGYKIDENLDKIKKYG